MSLTLGLIAALAWGLHDFLVRRLGHGIPIAALFSAVLGFGALAVMPFALAGGVHLPGAASPLILASGGSYAIGGYALWRAFGIGPVRLVAPICGAFPVIALAAALAQGVAVGLAQILAVLAVVAGVALVARGGTEDAPHGSPRTAVLWSALAATGFAATFGFGQAASAVAGELPATLAARLITLALIGALAISGTGLRGTLAAIAPHWRLVALMGGLDAGAMLLVLAAGGLPHPEFATTASSIFGVVTILLAWRFLGEAMSPTRWLGVAVTFAGIGWLAAY